MFCLASEVALFLSIVSDFIMLFCFNSAFHSEDMIQNKPKIFVFGSVLRVAMQMYVVTKCFVECFCPTRFCSFSIV